MADKLNNSEIDHLGESIAIEYLKNKGFTILSCNYIRKGGEIDIVARKTLDSDVTRATMNLIHFIQVKGVSYETKELLDWAVTHETLSERELLHYFKLDHLRKTAEAWIIENNWIGEIQVDVISLRIVTREKYATVKYIPNIAVE